MRRRWRRWRRWGRGGAVLLALLVGEVARCRRRAPALGAGFGLWRWASRRPEGRARCVCRGDLGVVPLLPWLAGWPLTLQAVLILWPGGSSWGPGGRCCCIWGVVACGLGGVALWVRAVPACATHTEGGKTPQETVPSRGRGVGAREESRASARWVGRGSSRLAGRGAPPAALPLLALAGAAYWNGALLDPLQFRGFPDYVTQLGGARRLLAGELPYNPDIRVWTDVNLPPVTLLLLFPPFTFFSDLGGKLAYFLLNQATFLAGLGVLLVVARAPARVIDPLCGAARWWPWP